jgi:hypothetical protein
VVYDAVHAQGRCRQDQLNSTRAGEREIVFRGFLTRFDDSATSNQHDVTFYLLQLAAESHIFEAEDRGSESDCRELKYTCPARETLVLKEGATVILLRNLSAGELLQVWRMVWLRN